MKKKQIEKKKSNFFKNLQKLNPDFDFDLKNLSNETVIVGNADPTILKIPEGYHYNIQNGVFNRKGEKISKSKLLIHYKQKEDEINKEEKLPSNVIKFKPRGDKGQEKVEDKNVGEVRNNINLKDTTDKKTNSNVVKIKKDAFPVYVRDLKGLELLCKLLNDINSKAIFVIKYDSYGTTSEIVGNKPVEKIVLPFEYKYVKDKGIQKESEDSENPYFKYRYKKNLKTSLLIQKVKTYFINMFK